jgi:act minimal PKS acyl carrier protein
MDADGGRAKIQFGDQVELELADIQDLVNTSGGDRVELDSSTLDLDFDEIGVDSLAVVELIDRIQETYAVPIADDVIQVLSTPRKLLGYVNKRLASRRS